MTPKTSTRVEKHSSPKCNERIQQMIRVRAQDLAERLDAIDERLREIDEEWDMERTLEACCWHCGGIRSCFCR
jgi:hypothetical protein